MMKNEIRINQFEGYSLEDVREYLGLLEGDQYRFYLPKTKVLYEDKLIEIAHEYVCLFWIGERLYEQGDRFVYFLPRLDQRGEFGFEVRTVNKNALALIITDALDLLNDRSERCTDLSDEAYEFWGWSDADDCACPEYYVISTHFLVHEP